MDQDAIKEGEALVFAKVRDRFASEADMLRWYRTKPLSGWRGKTAKDLVDMGHPELVIEHVDAVDAGVYS